MVNVDLLMISTTQPEKQYCLTNTIFSLVDKFNFKNLLIGIDKIQDHELSKKTLNLLSNLNFFTDIHTCNGMVSNLGSVIDSAKSEWILYCEDDVILKDFPDFNELLNFISNNFSGEVGIIDFIQVPGTFWNTNISRCFKENFLNESYHKVFNNYRLFERDELSYDMYFINFPIILIRRDIFTSCYFYALDYCKGKQIEKGFTVAFYAMGYSKMFKKIHIWDNSDFNINDCIDIEGKYISYNYLLSKLIIENRETHPCLPHLNYSVLDLNVIDRLDKIYSF